MNVLIIGGTRFVGYLTAWKLVAAGHRVSLFNRGSIPDPFGTRVERIRGNRQGPDFETLLHTRKFDAVIDFAAYAPDEVRRAIALFRGHVGHYVFISTGQVYLVRRDCPKPARETDFDGPVIEAPADERERGDYQYGIDKRGCEELLMSATDFPSTRIRIPMVHGERDYYRRIESYLWRILDGGPVIVPDGGAQPLRHVYGDDVARTLTSILHRPDTFGEAFNLAQGEAPSLRGVLTILCELLGAPKRFVDVPSEALTRAGLAPVAVSPFSGRWMSFLDPSKAEKVLGFTHTPVAEYLGRVVASFLAHPPVTPPESYARRADEKALSTAFVT